MSTKLETILENEAVQEYVTAHSEVLTEAAQQVELFKDQLKDFICENITEFLDDTLEDTAKNILVFSEAAITQYMVETLRILNEQIMQEEALAEAAVNDYL